MVREGKIVAVALRITSDVRVFSGVLPKVSVSVSGNSRCDCLVTPPARRVLFILILLFI